MFRHQASSENEQKGAGNSATHKKPWQPAQLRCLGHVTDIVQGGSGKLSAIGGDTGDVRKQPGQ